MRYGLALAAVVAAAFCAVPAASADDGGRDEVRVRKACGGSSELRLRLRSDDGQIRMELEIRSRGPATQWTVVVLRERRIAWRGTVRTARGGSVKIRRSFQDWFGTDTVAVRATARGGETCSAAATI